MATYTRFVDPDATAGGDGQSKALTNDGEGHRAYASLNEWEAAEQSAHGATDTDIVICCSNGGSHTKDNYEVVVDGWTDKDTSNWIIIQAEEASNAGTSWSSSKYRIGHETGDNAATPVKILENRTKTIGIQVECNLDGRVPSGWIIYGIGYSPPTSSDGHVHHIDSCFIKFYGAPGSAPSSPTVWTGILAAPPTTSPSVVPLYYMYNTIINNAMTGLYNGNGVAASFEHRAQNSYFYNNTIVGPWNQGLAGDSSGNSRNHYLKNNLISGATNPTSGDHSNTRCDYNATDQADLGYTAGANDHVLHTFTFVSSTDFALDSSDVGARGLGMSDPGSGLFSDDIVGSSRSAPWDIGAHKYVELTISGSACWGHSTGVVEDNIRTFLNNWTGTGSVDSSGDGEQLVLGGSEYMESEVVNTGVRHVVLSQNVYASGDTATLKYRHGATEVDCLSASWNIYSSAFESLGYVQLRLECTF